MTSKATVAANTMTARAAFPRCYGDAVLADSPVSYWRLDETSGTVAADSKGSNPGTYVNGPVLGQSGALPDTVNNRAPSFDGVDDRVDVPASASLNVASQITIEGWIYPTDTSSVHPIVEYGDAGTLGVHLWQYDAGNKLFANLIDTSGTSHQVVSTAVFTTNTWYHVALTYDGSTAILYVNGTEVARAVIGAITLRTALPVNLGRRATAGGLQNAVFAGKLDEIAIYPAALTAAQLRSHYNTGRCYKDTVLADSPAGYWRLGEGSGSTTAVDGMRGRHGTYVNGPTLNQTGALNGNANTAATFNGTNQYATVPYDSALNPAQLTVEAWAKPASTTAGTWQAVAGAFDAVPGGGYRGYWLGINGTIWHLEIDGGANGFTYIEGSTVVPGSWAHVVGTFNGTTGSLYVNGILVASGSATYTANATSPLVVGGTYYRSSGTYADFFKGSIDEVAVYGSALSQSRIQAHYLVGRSYKDTILDSGPAGYWRLGEGSGTTATDVTGASPGTYENGVVLGSVGPLAADGDTAASFDAVDDDVLGPDAFGYAGRAPMSAEFWLNPSTAGQNAWRPIVDKQSGNATSRDGWAVWLGPANDATYGNRIAFDRWLGTTHDFYSGNVQLPVGSWSHVAVTYDGTTITFYVNGAYDTSGTDTLSTNNATQPLRFASDAAVPDRYGGLLDEVALYSRALSATEVKLHYDSGRQ